MRPFELPKSDVLILAEDLTELGKQSELRDTLDCIERAEDVLRGREAMAEAMTKAEWSTGGHDVTLDLVLYKERVHYVHIQGPRYSKACINSTDQYPSITCQ